MNNPYDFYITPDEYLRAAEYGINYKIFTYRVRDLGWDKEKAMTTPVRKYHKRSEFATHAKQNGICYSTFATRCNVYGWDPERAANEAVLDPKSNALRASEATRKLPHEYVELAKSNGISYAAFLHRVNYMKWDLDKAAKHPIMTPKERGKLGGKKVRERYGDVNAMIFGKHILT